MIARASLLPVLSLLCAGSAAAGECANQRDVTHVLARLDRAQTKFNATTLQKVFAADAQIDAVSPAKSWKRGRTEFIEQHRADAAEENKMLAYAFDVPTIECNAGDAIKVVRRGCQVSNFSNGLTEISQTEEIEMRAGAEGLQITHMTSTLDAMRSGGKELFKNREFVSLPACTDAVAAKN